MTRPWARLGIRGCSADRVIEPGERRSCSAADQNAYSFTTRLDQAYSLKWFPLGWRFTTRDATPRIAGFHSCPSSGSAVFRPPVPAGKKTTFLSAAEKCETAQNDDNRRQFSHALRLPFRVGDPLSSWRTKTLRSFGDGCWPNGALLTLWGSATYFCMTPHAIRLPAFPAGSVL